MDEYGSVATLFQDRVGRIAQPLNHLSGYSLVIDSIYFDGLPEYSDAVIQQKAKECHERGFKPTLKQVGNNPKNIH